MGTQVRIASGARRVGGWVVEDDVEPAAGCRAAAHRPPCGAGARRRPSSTWPAGRRGAGRAPCPRFLRTRLVLARARSAPFRRPRRPVSRARDASPASAPAPPGLGDGDGGGPSRSRRRPVARRPGARRDRLAVAPEPTPGCSCSPRPQRGRPTWPRRLRADGSRPPCSPVTGRWPVPAGAWSSGHERRPSRPLPRLAAAVVLDAHDEVYHEERAPTWAAWAVVAERCPARRRAVRPGVALPHPRDPGGRAAGRPARTVERARLARGGSRRPPR